MGPQFIVNPLSDLFWHVNEVTNFPAVLFAPQLRSVSHTEQIHSNGQIVPSLSYTPQYDRINVEVLSKLLRADFSALVAENCATGHYVQFRGTRKATDDFVRHAVG